MANNWNLGVVAHLDGTKSKNQLNQDIQALKRVLDNVELKAKLDPNQVKNLENQLNKLQVSLTDVTIPQSTLNGLVTQINNALQGIQIPNINFNPSGVGNAGRQIGEIISKEAANAIGDVTSKVIGQGFTVSPKMSQKVQSELENIVKDWTNGKGKISSITIDTKTDFNEQTLENIEHLKSATVQYSNELGQVITKTLKYKQIGVNTFANGETEAIKGWVESASTYKATLESTTKSTNNFVNQQKKAVTDLTNQVNQIYKSAIDPNASKPIKNSGNLSNLENQYNDIITAIGKMGSASETTFTDERNSVNTLISDLKIVVREYKNAETAATSMRSKDVGTVKAIKTNELDEFIAKIQNSKVPMKEMKSEIASLKTSLSNITDTDSLTAYLNQFDIVSSKFKSLKEQFSKGSTVSSVIFNTSELEAQGKVYIQKVRNTIEAIKPELESKLRSAGYTDIEIKGVEKANGQIKSLTATVTDATGAFKQLNFQREKIQGKGKAQFGFVQTDDVKVIGTLSSSVETVQGNLTTLKNKWEEQGVLVGDFKTKVEQLETSLASVGSKGELNGLKSQIETLKTEASTIAEVNKIQHSLSIGDYDTQLKSYSIALQKAGVEGEDLKNKLKGASDALESLKTSTSGEEIIPSVVTARADELTNEFEKLANVVKNVKLDNTLVADDIKVNDTITRLNEQLRKNGNYASSAKLQIQEWINELKSGNVAEARLKAINSEAKALHSNMAQLGKIGKSNWQTFKEGVKSFTEWTLASVSVMEVVQAVKTMASNVKGLDDQLLELSKVSDLSADGLAKITEEAYELGETVGKTGTQVLEAITTFKRAGFDLSESTNMAEEALKMVNVAEGIDDASESAQYLISIMKGYQDTSSEFSKKILDSINEVSNTQAVDFDNLADGAQRLSAVANQAGVSFDQMLGVLTGGYEVLGNMEKTASGLITIFTRLQSIQLADEEDVESVAKLQETFSAATKGRVNIVDQTTGQLRGAYDILKDLNEVWNELDKNTQEGLAFAAGGTRQKSVFLSIMSNWESVEKSVQSATDSMGSAEVENEKYLDSISGKISQFESSVEQLSATVVNSDLIKFFVDLGTTGVKAIDGLVNALTPLGTIGLIGGGILGGKNLGKTYECMVSKTESFVIVF